MRFDLFSLLLIAGVICVLVGVFFWTPLWLVGGVLMAVGGVGLLKQDRADRGA